MLSIVITARNSLGLMLPFWKEDMDWSYKFVATASALMMVTMAISAPVLGSIIDRFGSRTIYATGMTVIGVIYILCSFMIEPWQLITLFSLIGGVAFAAMAPSLVSTTIAHHFKERLGLATSMATSGSTAGQFAIMPVFALLITWLSWRNSFFIAGLVILATAVVVFFLIGREPPKSKTDSSSTKTIRRIIER